MATSMSNPNSESDPSGTSPPATDMAVPNSLPSLAMRIHQEMARNSNTENLLLEQSDDALVVEEFHGMEVQGPQTENTQEENDSHPENSETESHAEPHVEPTIMEDATSDDEINMQQNREAVPTLRKRSHSMSEIEGAVRAPPPSPTMEMIPTPDLSDIEMGNICACCKHGG